jgi:hypothetical protein
MTAWKLGGFDSKEQCSLTSYTRQFHRKSEIANRKWQDPSSGFVPQPPSPQGEGKEFLHFRNRLPAAWRRLLLLGVCDSEGTFFSGPAHCGVYSCGPFLGMVRGLVTSPADWPWSRLRFSDLQGAPPPAPGPPASNVRRRECKASRCQPGM